MADPVSQASEPGGMGPPVAAAEAKPDAAAPTAAAGPTLGAQERVQKAVEFLSSPRVKETPLGRKVNFLKSKGLTVDEVARAFAQVGEKKTIAELENAANNVRVAPAQSSPAAAAAAAQPVRATGVAAAAAAPKPEETWKDYYIGATVAAGALWGLKQIALQFFDVDVRWKGEKKKASVRQAAQARELPPIPAADIPKLREMEERCEKLEAALQDTNESMVAVRAGQEKLDELCKASESMLKKNAEFSGAMARIEGMKRMHDRFTERLSTLEAAKKATTDAADNLKVGVDMLAKRIEELEKKGGAVGQAGEGAEAGAAAGKEDPREEAAPDAAAAPKAKEEGTTEEEAKEEKKA